jgi:hypothetical protein
LSSQGSDYVGLKFWRRGDGGTLRMERLGKTTGTPLSGERWIEVVSCLHDQ